MPFFFLISGYCSSNKNYDLKFSQYFLKYFKALYIPHFIIIAIYLPIGIFGIDFGSTTWLHDSIMLLLGPHSEWFIPCLFFSKVIFYPIYRMAHLTEDSRIRNIIYLFFIGLSFYLAEYLNDSGLHAKPTWLPVAVDCACVALAFVIAGSWLKEIQIEAIYETTPKKFMYSCCAMAAIVLWCIKYQTYTNVNNVAFGHSSISYFVFACILSMFFVIVCRFYCEHVSEKNIGVRILSLLGRHTIIVYAGHTILFYLFNQAIYKSTGILYHPMQNFKISLVFIYFIAAIFILSFVCLIWERLKNLKSLRMGKYKSYAICFAIGVMVLSNRMPVAAEELKTEDIVYINSVEDFIAFRDSVNSGNTYEGILVKQMVDMDLGQIENFEPIGIYESGNYFYGTYDGDGHSIDNLKIVRSDNCALFGILGGTVCNLKIGSGEIIGACVGSIASHATGESRIINCINYANVHGSVRAGGIADNFNGKIISCINYGTISSDNGEIGGIVSYDAIEIRNCSSTTKQINFDRGRVNYSNVTALNPRWHNFRLGVESIEQNVELITVYQKDTIGFEENASRLYVIGKGFYYIEKYFVDVFCGIIVLISLYKIFHQNKSV